MATTVDSGPVSALSIEYCDQCTLPTEYCEFTECAKKAAAAAAISADPDSATADGSSSEHKRQTRGGKAQGPKAKKQAEKKLEVFRSNRGKKKFVTVIVGMATFGVDLKEASKLFSKKFACSSSVTGSDEIIVQGDVKDELMELIPEKFPEIDLELVEDGGDQKR